MRRRRRTARLSAVSASTVCRAISVPDYTKIGPASKPPLKSRALTVSQPCPEMRGRKYGYARVSTDDQGAGMQLRALRQLHGSPGFDRFFRGFDDLCHAEVDVERGDALDRFVVADCVHHEGDGVGGLGRERRERDFGSLATGAQFHLLLRHVEAAGFPEDLEVLETARQVPTSFKDVDAVLIVEHQGG